MSSLKKQLLALQLSSIPSKKYSILYEDASDIGIDEIYKNAKQGFYDLCGLEHQLSRFESILFNEVQGYKSRGQLTQKESDELDKQIDEFLFYMSPFLLLDQAKMILEYFIRRFSVNEYDVDALMAAYLPYHESEIFSKLLSIMKIENTMWSFLSNIKKNKSVLPRVVLIKQCCKDIAVFQFICELPQHMNERNMTYKHILTFYISVVGEALSSQKSVYFIIF